MMKITGCTHILHIIPFIDDDDEHRVVKVGLFDHDSQNITASIVSSAEKDSNGGMFKIGRYGSFVWLVDLANTALTELDDPYDIDEIYYQLNELPISTERIKELTVSIYYFVNLLWGKNESSESGYPERAPVRNGQS